jgi:hypothetical protein
VRPGRNAPVVGRELRMRDGREVHDEDEPRREQRPGDRDCERSVDERC